MKLRLSLVFFVFAFRLCGQTEAPAHPLVPLEKSSTPIASGMISKEQLRIPYKAIEELQRSQHDYSSGNVRSSVRHLEKALRLYPNCPEAYNNLGAQYIELQEYEKAVAAFQRAIQIDSTMVQPFNNLSVALFKLRRYADSEAASRQVLALDANNSIARYVLGCALANENRNAAEALVMLDATKTAFPESRLMMAKILLHQGAAEDAKRELHDYLALPGIENAAIAQRWLAQLSRAPEPVRNAARPDAP